MIVSNDTIMIRPPYTISQEIVKLVAQISEQLGKINAVHLHKLPAELRKKNRIKTIQSSLEIEGNTLSLAQVTALINNKRVVAPQKDIIEVKNAIKAYEAMPLFKAYSLQSLCKAHALLMHDLVEHPGKFRTQGVGIAKGKSITHVAPPGSRVKGLMKQLFEYLKRDKEITLIKSCVFHYEFEFIHPFMDGNGRMGRLWQNVLLSEYNSVFGFLPLETLIKSRQKKYYEALAKSDKLGHSTPFIEFMLEVIQEALREVVAGQNKTLTTNERIEIFAEYIISKRFTRKDYLQYFKTISTATASRDLQQAVSTGQIKKYGHKNKTVYEFKK